MNDALSTQKAGQLTVKIYPNAQSLGQASAGYAAEQINKALHQKGRVRVIFATGASQFSFLEELVKHSLDWDKVEAFHLDEYISLDADHPASFRRYLRERLFDKVNPGMVHYLDADTLDPDLECERYADLLLKDEIDLACIGIGENGHIAFNDPPVADFEDPKLVKIVELDESCRRQQFGEGWFPTMDDVPKQAMTLTIPAIMRCLAISCVVPDERKAQAVKNALEGPIDTSCPASILRQHDNAILWLDSPAASLL